MTGLIAGVHAGQEIGWHHPASEHDHPDDVSDDVSLVLAFLNTLDIEAGTDVLDDDIDWRRWIADTGLPDPGDGDRERARTVRDALRTSIGGDRLPRDDGGGAIRVELLRGVPTLVATDPIGAVLAAATRLAVLGHWDRMKICAAHDCRWAFFDRSRNRSRTWCSMRVCGNRTKARNWRERARAGVS